jgi:L-amino acid N-acyltransferase YncA
MCLAPICSCLHSVSYLRPYLYTSNTDRPHQRIKAAASSGAPVKSKPATSSEKSRSVKSTIDRWNLQANVHSGSQNKVTKSTTPAREAKMPSDDSPAFEKTTTREADVSQLGILKGYLESTILHKESSGEAMAAVHHAAPESNQGTRTSTPEPGASHSQAPAKQSSERGLEPSGRGGMTSNRGGLAPRPSPRPTPLSPWGTSLPQNDSNHASSSRRAIQPTAKWRTRPSQQGFVINEDSQSSGHVNSANPTPPSAETVLSDANPLNQAKRRIVREWIHRCPKEGARDLSADFGLDCPTLVSKNWSQYDKIEGLSREQFWERMRKGGLAVRDDEPDQPRAKDDTNSTPWWCKTLMDHAGGQYLGAMDGIPGESCISAQKAAEQDAEIPEDKAKFCVNNHLRKMSASKMALREQEVFWSTRTQEELWNQVTVSGPIQTRIWGVAQNLPDPVKSKPDINIYIRNGDSSDVDDTLRIYNSLVKKTWCTLDSVRLSVGDLSERLKNLTGKNLPWIVAITPKKSKLVGFALVDDMGTRNGYMNLSAGIEVYVDCAYQHQGVGKALLDQTLSRVEYRYKKTCLVKVLPGHERRRAAEIIRYKPIQLLIASIPYQAEDADDLVRMKWISTWLNQFGFRKCGDLPGAMCRKGK